jgi:hypothetical protein
MTSEVTKIVLNKIINLSRVVHNYVVERGTPI